MRRELAKTVVAQDLDDPAFADAPVTTLIHHALQLGPQRIELPDPFADLFQVPHRDAVGFVAGALRRLRQRQKLPDIADIEGELARMTDEVEPLDHGHAIAPLLSF